jgi:hypothetical protein
MLQRIGTRVSVLLKDMSRNKCSSGLEQHTFFVLCQFMTCSLTLLRIIIIKIICLPPWRISLSSLFPLGINSKTANPIDSWQTAWTRGSAIRKSVTYTGYQKNWIDTESHASNGNRTHDTSIWLGVDISFHRPCGHKTMLFKRKFDVPKFVQSWVTIYLPRRTNVWSRAKGMIPLEPTEQDVILVSYSETGKVGLWHSVQERRPSEADFRSANQGTLWSTKFHYIVHKCLPLISPHPHTILLEDWS